MKKLSRYVIAVKTDEELAIARKFYLRASRRPLNINSLSSFVSRSTLFVGMQGRNVMCSDIKYDFETVVPFSKMHLLADTASRERALVASGWDVAGWSVPKKVTKPKPAVEKNPLVQFYYPSSKNNGIPSLRSVRLISADRNYYVGLEILPANKFAFKKFFKCDARQFSVLEFNPKQ